MLLIFKLFLLVLFALVFLYLGWHFGQHGVSFLKKKAEFSIGIYTGDNPLNMSSIKNNPVLTGKDVTDADALFVADPFLIKKDNLWYMFFEVKDSYDSQTRLAYATSEDGLDWKYQKIILRETFSQSYPHVFEWKGEYYMLPESYPTNSIRLYKSKNFPEEWYLEKTLIKGKDYVDPTIFRYNNKWWIMASTSSNKNLHLFYSDNLTSDWKEHPMSPIIKEDKSRSRPAGGIIEYENSLYRFAQDCSKYYGERVFAFKITKLTETEYEEELIEKPVVDKGLLGWNRKGMHTFDIHKLNGSSWIAAVDGYNVAIKWDK